MMELSTLIYNQINPICVSFVDHYPIEEEEPQYYPKTYPYVEIKIPNVIPNNSFSDKAILEIDIWDNKGTNVNEIENIADLIHKALNRLQYNDSVMNVSINRNTPHRLLLSDPIINIQRRQLRYFATVYHI